jgi:hypothetical protein
MTPEFFEKLKDYANKQSLKPYNDGRLWFYLKDPVIALGELAHAAYTGNIAFIKQLIQNNNLLTFDTIEKVPGNDFLCIYFDDAYFLEPYE